MSWSRRGAASTPARLCIWIFPAISIRASRCARMVAKNGRAYIQAGGGVVADSVPEREYQETVNKARALVTALEIAHRGANGSRAE